MQCVSLLLMWQLQQYLHDQTAPPPAWSTGVTRFAQQLHSLLGLRVGTDLRVQSLAVRTLADFYLIFKSAEFKVWPTPGAGDLQCDHLLYGLNE